MTKAKETKPTQQERVLQYIKYFGSITRVQAMEDIGVANLTSVISKIRQSGIEIRTIDVHAKNRYGQRIVYAKYVLGEEEDA